MSLDDLLKPAKWVDEQVLRQYTKVAKRWEDKRRNIYLLSSTLGVPSILLVQLGANESLLGLNDIGLLLNCAFYCWDFGYNLTALTTKGLEEKLDFTDGAIASIPVFEFAKKIARSTRLFTLLGGIGLVGKSAYDFINYFVNGEPLDNTIGDALTLGTGLLGIASSQYLKDRNPKLLDKAPFWKTAYQWAKEKVKSLTPEPQPLPQPAPLQASAGLENYV